MCTPALSLGGMQLEGEMGHLKTKMRGRQLSEVAPKE